MPQFESRAIGLTQFAGNVEPQARALMVRGKEGLEDMFAMRFIHALTIILDAQIHPALMNAVADKQPDAAFLLL